MYPTFYSLLYPDLRDAMANAAVTARKDGAGVWTHDVTDTGLTLRSRDRLRDEAAGAISSAV